jgi:hypothetical protein
LVQDRGGAEFQTEGILLYVEDLRLTMKIKLGGSSRNAGKRGTNKDIGLKDIFEMGSNICHQKRRLPATEFLHEKENGSDRRR